MKTRRQKLLSILKSDYHTLQSIAKEVGAPVHVVLEDLKHVEKRMGIERRELIGNMHGGDAVRLWKMYKATGDEDYINLLVEYNEEDIMNLRYIANHFVRQLKDETINRYTD